MNRVAPDVRAVWQQSWITPWVWPVLVAYNIQLGLVLLLGDPKRIAGPSFGVIRDFGGHWAGLVFLAAGIAYGAAAFVGRRWLLRTGFVLGCAHLLLAAGFLAAVLNEPPLPVAVPTPFGMPPLPIAPAGTGPGTYLLVAVISFANSFVYGSRGPLGKETGA